MPRRPREALPSSAGVPDAGKSPHEFPSAPVLAVGGLVFRGNEVLLVKRGREPNRGRWSIPGGALDAGETVEAAVAREVREETGVAVRPVRVVEVRDYVERTADSRVRWHYVLIDVLCEWSGGEPRAGSDAENARFVPLREIGDYDVTSTALEAIEKAVRLRGP